VKIEINVEYNIGDTEGRLESIDLEINDKLEEAFANVRRIGSGYYMRPKVRAIQFNAEV
jgi:hypothetical protein